MKHIKKIMLFLVLAGCVSAPVYLNHFPEPPSGYAFRGTLKINYVDAGEEGFICPISPLGIRTYECGDILPKGSTGECRIWLPTGGSAAFRAAMKEHVLGHCGGWAYDHPNPVYTDLTKRLALRGVVPPRWAKPCYVKDATGREWLVPCPLQ